MDPAPSEKIELSEHFSLKWNIGHIQHYFNHSCNPNCSVSWDKGMPHLTARRDISKDEELLYNYNTVALSLSPFHCYCGDKSCIGIVMGFIHLTAPMEYAILDMLSPEMMKKHNEFEEERHVAW